VYDSYGRKCNSRFFLNYGFINLGNDANEVPIVVRLDPSEESYEIKLKLKCDHRDSMKFRVVDNLHEEIMMDFISFIRFCIYDGDLAQLYLAKNHANLEARNKRKNQNN
jgi:histone-lysine N-methyltransferase SETD3